MIAILPVPMALIYKESIAEPASIHAKHALTPTAVNHATQIGTETTTQPTTVPVPQATMKTTQLLA